MVSEGAGRACEPAGRALDFTGTWKQLGGPRSQLGGSWRQLEKPQSQLENLWSQLEKPWSQLSGLGPAGRVSEREILEASWEASDTARRASEPAGMPGED